MLNAALWRRGLTLNLDDVPVIGGAEKVGVAGLKEC
jgi:hypothetical protein